VEFVFGGGWGAAYFCCAEIPTHITIEVSDAVWWEWGKGVLPHSVYQTELDGFLKVGLQEMRASFLLLGGGIFVAVFAAELGGAGGCGGGGVSFLLGGLRVLGEEGDGAEGEGGRCGCC